MIHIQSEEQFESEILKSGKTVMVDFYADWCGTCKAFAPLLEELDHESKSYEIARINVDDFPAIAQQYRVASIPTILVFREGVCTGRNVGLASREALQNLI